MYVIEALITLCTLHYLYIGIIDNPRDSIFTYSQSGSWNTFYKTEYTPLFEAKFNDSKLEEEALKVSFITLLLASAAISMGEDYVGSVVSVIHSVCRFLPNCHFEVLWFYYL